MRRSSLEEEEVRLTSAIGGSKTDKRNGGAFNQSNVFRPEMLQTPSVETVADFFDLGMRSQVVDVPVRPARELEMVGEPGTDASRPKGAADINVEARLKL
jgi:hypothetical protein